MSWEDKYIFLSLRKKWRDILRLRRGRVPRKEIEGKIKALYTISGFKKPLFIWSLSPIEYFFYNLEFIRRKYEKEVKESGAWYKTLFQKEIFLERAKENFKSISYFEKFKNRIEINLKKISDIDKGKALKCKIFPVPNCDLFSEKMREYLNMNERRVYDYYRDMGRHWGWMESIYSEINRIFNIDGFFPMELWLREFEEDFKNFSQIILYVGDIIFPSELLELGFFPEKKVVPFLELLYKWGKFKDKERKKVEILLEIFQYGIGFFPYENICLIVEPPLKIKTFKYNPNFNKCFPFTYRHVPSFYMYYEDLTSDLAHSTRGPAITFRDGFCIWAFKGMLMPPEYFRKFFANKNNHYTKEMVLKLWEYGSYTYYKQFWDEFIAKYVDKIPSEAISVDLILRESNAHIRAKLVNKIGLQRIVEEKKPKIIDKWGDYELIEIELQRRKSFFEIAHFLKMKNPSTGEIHLEGVPPEIMTCKEALSWRIGGLEWEPLEMT